MERRYPERGIIIIHLGNLSHYELFNIEYSYLFKNVSVFYE
ncbi:MAG: hypothetical protein BAJALOKI2v1_240012 [Promethearchaeota archaeon]|nr:MAG: hypothetical protein BAJALOKI2v1_240012 [Candidatus Lokiarchaeota archaeon]